MLNQFQKIVFDLDFDRIDFAGLCSTKFIAKASDINKTDECSVTIMLI